MRIKSNNPLKSQVFKLFFHLLSNALLSLLKYQTISQFPKDIRREEFRRRCYQKSPSLKRISFTWRLEMIVFWDLCIFHLLLVAFLINNLCFFTLKNYNHRRKINFTYRARFCLPLLFCAAVLFVIRYNFESCILRIGEFLVGSFRQGIVDHLRTLGLKLVIWFIPKPFDLIISALFVCYPAVKAIV